MSRENATAASGLSAWRLARLLAGVRRIGREVAAIQARGFHVTAKADASPLTEADLTAHHGLVALLARCAPGLPVLSEEAASVPAAVRHGWSRYWLVDPLDGTREFVERRPEYTLNVALIDAGVPVLGVVHAPALGGAQGTTWVGQPGYGAWRLQGGQRTALRVRPLPDPGRHPWRVLGSRRHGAVAFAAFCAALPAHERLSLGSSLKFCRIAEGAADLYPRLAPTCEWDSAAAQAVLVAAGGAVLEARALRPLRYNQRASLLNPDFIACGARDARWERALAEALAVSDGR